MPLSILLPAIGSSGDVHPVIGLGKALKARGHRVTVVTNEIFSAPVRTSGLEFIALGSKADAMEAMSDPRLWHVRKGLETVVEHGIVPNLRRLYDVIAANRDSSTVVAATSLCLGARVAQEKLGIPTATLHLSPAVFRSLVDNGKLGSLDLGPGKPRILKRAFFWIADTLFIDRLIGPSLNAFRSTLGLSPVHGIFRSYINSPQLVLGLFPEWFAAPQVDWPRNTHLTGFILHDDDGREALPTEAEDFLKAGPPPLLVTPGSAAMDRGRFFRTTVDACRELGARAMLVTNHPGQIPANLPDNIRAFSYLPFSRVLPRCSAIAYHGGIGTLSQAVKAGIPHLVVSNGFDQPDNGQRIECLGIGRTFDQGLYNRRNAVSSIGDLVSSENIRARCKELAPRVDSAASLERACALIEGLA
jgi:rhamnosyltransferase subunit B